MTWSVSIRWLVLTHLWFCEGHERWLFLDVCAHRNVFEREHYLIREAKLNKVCINDHKWSVFIQVWMNAFVKLFHVWSDCLIFVCVCGLKHVRLSSQKLHTYHCTRLWIFRLRLWIISHAFVANFSPYSDHICLLMLGLNVETVDQWTYINSNKQALFCKRIDTKMISKAFLKRTFFSLESLLIVSVIGSWDRLLVP